MMAIMVEMQAIQARLKNQKRKTWSFKLDANTTILVCWIEVSILNN